VKRGLVIWRWLSSRVCRSALDEYRRTRTQLQRQRDRLAPEAVATIAARLHALRLSILAAEPATTIRSQRDELRTTAYAHLEDPRRNRLKDGSEMALTALVAVLALRTFFAQPMEVPTSSMQPTLYGVTIQNLLRSPGAEIPGLGRRLVDRWVYGRTYYHLRTTAPGKLRSAEPPQPAARWLAWLPTLRQQRFQIGEAWYRVLLPRLELPNPMGLPAEFLFIFHAGVDPDRQYQTGDDLVKLAVTTGDHVLIDRFTINFRRPHRGEIIVFGAHEIPRLQEDAFYLKRLVALGGDTVQIGDDRHLRLNGERLDVGTPYFDEIYGFRGPPVDGEYSGHIHDGHAQRLRMRPGFLSPQFPSGSTVRRVIPGRILVLGDNTVSSYDSRKFGDLPETAIVGRLLAVYWPFSPRFGFSVN
jgi:signal peptidase I